MFELQIRADIQALAQQLRNLVQIGIIVEIDYNNALCRVKLDEDSVTDWLPWVESLAGSTHTWTPPKLKDQCLILSANGNLRRGVIIGFINQTKFPQLSTDGDLQKIKFANGSQIEVHETDNTMKVHCVGALTLTATGNLVIQSDTDISIAAPHIGLND